MTRDLLEFMGNIALRVTVVLAAAGLISLLLRRASAALRHWVWVLAMSAALLMPALVLAAPQWNITLPTSPTQQKSDVPQTNNLNPNSPLLNPTPLPANNSNMVRTAAQNNVLDATPLPQNLNVDPVPAPAEDSPANTPASAKKSDGFNLPQARTWLLILWVEGALVVLVIGFRQYWKVRRLVKVNSMGSTDLDRSQPYPYETSKLEGVDLGRSETSPYQLTALRRGQSKIDPISQGNHPDLLPDILKTLNIRRPVQLIVSPAVSIPMTLGLRHPIILLPAESAEWDDARRRVVLLHECIHIARYDALMGWLSLILCAVHWFNPLAWLAARRLNTEGELACDDRVLQLGTTGPDYAQHLVEIARHALPATSSPSPITPGLAKMASTGNLGERVQGILDKRRQRGASKWQRFIGLALIIALILPLISQIERRTLPPQPAHAQGDITLTVAVEEQGMSFYPPNAFDPFEAQYGVNVELVRDDSARVGLSSLDSTAFLDGVADYVDGGDVLFHHYHSYLNPIGTRAGYFLDLAPLAATDPNFNESVYFSAALDAYRWDNGLWALPLSVEPLAVIYDQVAFDTAGLTYPDETWTLDQFIHAARALAVTEPDGTVSRAGMVGDPMPLFRALLNRPVTPPFASDAELMALWQTWADLEEEGVVAAYDSGDGTTPLQLAGTWRLFSMMPSDNQTWAASRLPNGTGAINSTSGFVVSAGTAHPELAFALAQYLSGLSGLSTVISAASLPSQPALIGLQETVIPQMFIGGKTPEIAEFERTVIESVPPTAEHTFKDYFWEASVLIGDQGLAPDAALADVDTKIANGLAAAQARRDAGVVINIAPPPQPIEAPDGEVVVRFHLSQTEDRVVNFDQWQRVAQEFAAQDAEVFAVELLTGDSMREGEADCYIGNVFNPATYDQNYLLNLDPLMQADPNFDSRDFIAGALEGVQYKGQTWAYPLAAQPTVLWVEENLFAQAGLAVPTGEWTIDEFMDALHQIQNAGVEVEYPFVPSFDGADLLVLAAAFGGLPIDFTTTPATVNLTDPTNLAALQQVLDLSRDGLMMYREPFAFDGASGAIIADSLMNLPSYLWFREMGGGLAHRMVNFPKGNQYTPVSYEMLAGYILRESPNPEACYRWLAYTATHPEILAGASTRLSQADNPLTETAFGPDIAAAYSAFHRMMQEPNLVAMPMLNMSGTDVLAAAETIWINEAFTAYVQDPNTDLGTVLAQAQQRVEEYRACMVDHPRPVYEADPLVWQAYDTKLQECAVAVDPDVMSKPPFSMMYGGQ